MNLVKLIWTQVRFNVLCFPLLLCDRSSHPHQNNIPINAVMSGVHPPFLFFQTKWTPSQAIDFSGVHVWLPTQESVSLVPYLDVVFSCLKSPVFGRATRTLLMTARPIPPLHSNIASWVCPFLPTTHTFILPSSSLSRISSNFSSALLLYTGERNMQAKLCKAFSNLYLANKRSKAGSVYLRKKTKLVIEDSQLFVF